MVAGRLSHRLRCVELTTSRSGAGAVRGSVPHQVRTAGPASRREVVAQAGKKSAAKKAQNKKKAPAGKGKAAKVEQPLPDWQTSATCPCGSGDSYDACCEPFIYGDATPSTCEELMRSRYSAFAKRETKYIVATTHPEHLDLKGLSETDLVQDVALTAKNCSFHKLAVLETRPGETADESLVAFRAWFKFVQYKGRKAVQGEEWQTLTETSTFKKAAGRWMYLSGEVDVTPMPYGDTAPLKQTVDKAAAAGLADLAEKAGELQEQARAIFDGVSVKDGMKNVFGGMGKK